MLMRDNLRLITFASSKCELQYFPDILLLTLLTKCAREEEHLFSRIAFILVDFPAF